MRILIVGVGATGGYFGARLLNAGRDVTFLVRPPRAAQLASDGLHLSSPNGDLDIAKSPVITSDKLAEPFGLIVLSCKAYDLDDVMDSIAPAVGPETAILPLLNGMAHMAALDTRFGAEHVLGGAANISAVRDPDGRIRHLNSLDRIYYGERGVASSARLEAIQAALADANFEQHLRPNILQDMWDKWVTISTAAGITCLLRGAIGDIVAAGGTPLVHQLLAETSSIAAAEGFPTPQPHLDQLVGYFTRAGSLFTASMFRDLEAGAPIEANHILGDLLACGDRRHLATPLLAVANYHLRVYEARRARESA